MKLGANTTKSLPNRSGSEQREHYLFVMTILLFQTTASIFSVTSIKPFAKSTEKTAFSIITTN